MPPADIATARLKLRPLAPADQAVVVASLNDLEVTGWLAVVPYPYTAEDFDLFQREIAVPGQTFAVEDAIGFVGIIGLEDATLGYWLAPGTHGQGFATEAARGVLGWHFAEGLGPVASGYFEGNARSANVLRKLGFIETGRNQLACRALNTVRPHVDMLLTREAYIAALPNDATSARLTYRPLQATDADALHTIVSHWEVTRELGNFPWPADQAFSLGRARPFSGQGFAWGIFLDGAMIGTVGVTAGELGYMLHPAHHRRGYVSEACLTALTRAFGHLGLAEVHAGVWADNLASRALLAKLGFKVAAETFDLSIARGEKAAGFNLTLNRADWLLHRQQ